MIRLASASATARANRATRLENCQFGWKSAEKSPIKKRDAARHPCRGSQRIRRPVLWRCGYPLAALSVPSYLSKQAEADENQGRFGCCLKSWLPVPGNSAPGKTKSVNKPFAGSARTKRTSQFVEALRGILQACTGLLSVLSEPRWGSARRSTQDEALKTKHSRRSTQVEALGCRAYVFSSPSEISAREAGRRPPTSAGAWRRVSRNPFG